MRGSSAPSACHLCGSADLEFADEYELFKRVTSDCKPWPRGGKLARCASCGLVQALVDQTWRTEAERIYADYSLFHQGSGHEQFVFEGRNVAGTPRSFRLIEFLARAMALPRGGRLLDIGYGNGAFLSAGSQLLPEWSLCGLEAGDRYQSQVGRIPGVKNLYTGDISAVPGKFDLISLVHVLEHVPSPVGFLRGIRQSLAPEGILLIDVPDCLQNYFVLPVADHCTHFSKPSLNGVVEAAGFEILESTDAWISKEITLVARPGPEQGTLDPALDLFDLSQEVFQGYRRLREILVKARPLCRRLNFGVFGTAIAATWLDAETDHVACFFVDEDRNRIGGEFMGRPVLAPGDLPGEATIFLALPQPLASQVAARLDALGLNLTVVTP